MKKTFQPLALLFTIITSLVSCTNNPEEKETVSLSNSFKDDFFIGAAINENQILETDSLSVSILENEYNTITPENCMKWMHIQPGPDSFYFDLADKYVAFGEKNNMHIVGHTLVWHSQIAGFMNEIKDSIEMAKHLQNHINTVVTRYKGKIDTWDVVNEALNEDGSLRESLFLNVMGEKYIEHAFKLAEKADPEADLIYNDYNLWNPEKREGVVRLVKQLQESGAKINGVGMQAHWSLKEPSIEDIEKSIIAYSELGVKVMFTELDITVIPNPWDLEGAEVGQNFSELEGDDFMNPYSSQLPDSIQAQLAERYEDIFRLFLKYEDKISRVTFWGVSDAGSWLNNWPIRGRTNHPLLFDRDHQPKKAYYSILNLKNTSN